MLLVCYNLLNSQNIPINLNNSEKWLVTDVAKKAAEVAQKKEQ